MDVIEGFTMSPGEPFHKKRYPPSAMISDNL